MKKLYKDRLLKVAKALRESKTPKKDFSMLCYGNSCGTPACALGHYAARRDLQRAFKLEVDEYGFDSVRDPNGNETDYQEAGQAHFGLSEAQAEELFGGDGCNSARTALAAAKYIERFVEQQA